MFSFRQFQNTSDQPLPQWIPTWYKRLVILRTIIQCWKIPLLYIYFSLFPFCASSVQQYLPMTRSWRNYCLSLTPAGRRVLFIELTGKLPTSTQEEKDVLKYYPHPNRPTLRDFYIQRFKVWCSNIERIRALHGMSYRRR